MFCKICAPLHQMIVTVLELLVSLRELSYRLRSLKTYTNKPFKDKYSYKLYLKVEFVPRSKNTPSQL
jgi:hypothetical protein